jgi:hypothetical protein
MRHGCAVAMTSEVIDSTHRLGCSGEHLHREELVMTTLTVPATNAESQLRRVLQADGVVTAAVGLFGLLGPSWYAGPSWLARGVGLVFLLVGIAAAILSRSSRVALVGTVVAELAFAWTVTAVALAALFDMDMAGREVLLVTAAGTLVFGILETRLVRAMR